jgi:hypothetical protein
MVAPPPNDSARKAFMANCTDYIELSTGAKDVNQEAVRIAREFQTRYYLYADTVS